MAGRIPQHFIDELVARTDIIEVIGGRVQLKRAGREYKACCPFHDEKTPSFTVSPDKQFYHCFGCGAHGTVLGFVMELRPSRLRRSRRGARRARRARGAARGWRCRAPHGRTRTCTSRWNARRSTSASRWPARRRRGITSRAAASRRRPSRVSASATRPTAGTPCSIAMATTAGERQTLLRAGLVIERSARARGDRSLRSIPRPHHVSDPRRARARRSASAAGCSTRASPST